MRVEAVLRRTCRATPGPGSGCASNSARRPGRSAAGRSHLRDQEAAPSSGRKSSVMLDCGALASRTGTSDGAAFETSKKKMPFWPLQQAQQPAAGQDVLVGREVAVVRLVADVARRRNGNGPDDLAVVVGVLVEVDDGEEVRGDAGLIARPDVEGLRPFFVMTGSPASRLASPVPPRAHATRISMPTRGTHDSFSADFIRPPSACSGLELLEDMSVEQRRSDQFPGCSPRCEIRLPDWVIHFPSSRLAGEMMDRPRQTVPSTALGLSPSTLGPAN